MRAAENNAIAKEYKKGLPKIRKALKNSGSNDYGSGSMVMSAISFPVRRSTVWGTANALVAVSEDDQPTASIP